MFKGEADEMVQEHLPHPSNAPLINLRGTMILQEHTQQLPGVDFDDVDVADSSISSPVRRMIFFAKKVQTHFLWFRLINCRVEHSYS